MTRPPQAYPWAVPLRAGVLDQQGFHERPVQPPDGRIPVLASGSNASPEVVRDKLAPSLGVDADEQVVFTPVRVAGLGVGHSAHVSRPGYVAAAPYRLRNGRRGAAQAFALAWFTPPQLSRIDASEPQYVRLALPADLGPRTHAEADPLRGVQLYVSRHGLIAESAAPVTFRSQEEIFGWLRARLVCLQARTLPSLTDAALREQVRAELASGGWSAPSLLGEGAQH